MIARRFITFFVAVGTFVSLGLGSPRALIAQQKGQQTVTPQCVTGCGGGSYSVSVTPDGSHLAIPANSTNRTASFTVTNTGSSSDTYSFSCSRSGGVTCVSVSPYSATLSGGGTASSPAGIQPLCIGCGGGGSSTTVTVTFNVGTTDGDVYLHASGNASDQGWYSVSVGEPPLVDASPYNYDRQGGTACAASCFAATFGYSTVPYYSLDTPRNVTLAYNSDRVDPKPFIFVNAAYPTTSPAPTKLQFQVKKSDGSLITFLNGETTLNFNPSTAWLRVGGQFDAAANGMGSTGAYSVTIVVSAVYPALVKQTTVASKVVVVNENGSAIARGWEAAGVQRVYATTGGVIITDGTGASEYFATSGSAYTSPTGDFSTLVNGTPIGGSGWTRVYPDSTKIVFNSGGREIQALDKLGHGTSFVYDGSNRLWKVQDPTNSQSNSREIVLGYGSYGLATITDPFGRQTSLSVASNHTLTSVTDLDGKSTHFGYDGSLRLTSVTDRNGFVTNYTMASTSGKLAAIVAPTMTVYGDSSVRPTTTLHDWHAAGVPYSSTATPMTAPLADTVYGRVIDPLGHTTRFTVNKWGQPVQTTDPLGMQTTITYNASGQPLTVIQPDGGVNQVAYDANGNPTYTLPAGSDTSHLEVGPWGITDSTWGGDQPASHANVVGGLVQWTRYGATDTTTGFKTTYTYETYGRLTTTVDPAGHLLTEAWYGGTNGNRSKDSVPGDIVTTYGYDTFGRVTSVHKVGHPTSTTTRDALGRPLTVADGVNPNPIRMSYDSVVTGGVVTTVTDPKGLVYKTTTNSNGLVVARTDPHGHAETFEYDRDGRLKRWTNRRGQHVDYSYDADGRLLKRTGGAVSPDSTIYSANGDVVTNVSGVETETDYLNIRGQRDSMVAVIGSRAYRRHYYYHMDSPYRSSGRLDSVYTYDPSNNYVPETYAYNSASTGALRSVDLGSDGATLFTDNEPMYSSIRYSSQLLTELAHSDVHQTTSITQVNGNNQTSAFSGALDRELQTDSTGRITKQMQDNGTTGSWYGYDGLGRLVSDQFVHDTIQTGNCSYDPEYGWMCSNYQAWVTDSTHSYSYDAVGNRTDHAAVYDTVGGIAGNRIRRFNGCRYSSDLDGNVTSRVCGTDSVAFEWSADNMLTAVTEYGVRTELAYNSSGLVGRMSIGGTPQRYFLWDGGQLVDEVNASDNQLYAQDIYRGTDDPLAMRLWQSPTSLLVLYPHRDGLGSIVGLSDNSQALRMSYSYDDFGALESSSTSNVQHSDAVRARWKGALWLGTPGDLYYMRARWYEPQSGRFLSQDPVFTPSVSPYVFAADDPISGDDPTGMAPCVGEWVHMGNRPDGSLIWGCSTLGRIVVYGTRGGDPAGGQIPGPGDDLPGDWSYVGDEGCGQWNANDVNPACQAQYRVSFAESAQKYKTWLSAQQMKIARSSQFAKFLYCTTTADVGLQWGLTALDVAGVLGANELSAPAKLVIGVAAGSLALRGSAGGAGLSAASLGVDFANRTLAGPELNAAGDLVGWQTELLPGVGQYFSGLAALNDVFGSDGLIAAYGGCMAGLH